MVVLVGVIAVSYLIETMLDRPDWGLIAFHAVVSQFSGTESILLSVGIIGATVMPHVIFLHSSLTQQRIVPKDPIQAKRIFRFEVIDVLIAMGLAGLVNTAMLIMAAATFHANGLTGVGSIEEAHVTLKLLLGQLSSTVFAISLLASGLSSSTVGTMAGQVIMQGQGFLHWHIPLWLRRGLPCCRRWWSSPSVWIQPGRWSSARSSWLWDSVRVDPACTLHLRSGYHGSAGGQALDQLAASVAAGLIVALSAYLLAATFTGGGL
jgi:manganese transport protein